MKLRTIFMYGVIKISMYECILNNFDLLFMCSVLDKSFKYFYYKYLVN